MMTQSWPPRTDSLTLTVADTEYEYKIPPGTTGIRIQPRQDVGNAVADLRLKVSFVRGQSGSNFWTIHRPPSKPLEFCPIHLPDAGGSVFVQSPTAGAVVEFVLVR